MSFTGRRAFSVRAIHRKPPRSLLPALDGIEERREAGARVADVGCGLGESTILMAKAYPKSSFVGFDYHEESVHRARKRAEVVTNRVRFEVADAKSYPGSDYDLVTMFDALHDMGDPIGVSFHVRESLKKDGAWMLVEPNASDRAEENFHPIGRAYYAGSTLLCTPGSLAQDVEMALGAQAGEERLREVVVSGGFTRFRRDAETPFNLVLEARP